MNTVTYTSFNENSKHYLDSIDSSNQEIIIMKNKKPAFKILQINPQQSDNLLKNSILYEGGYSKSHR